MRYLLFFLIKYYNYVFSCFYGTKFISYYDRNTKKFNLINKSINIFPYPISYFLVIYFYGKKYLYKQNDKICYSIIKNENLLLPPIMSIKSGEINLKNEFLSFHCSTPLIIILKYYNLRLNNIEISKFDNGIKKNIIDIESNKTKSIYEIIEK
jgi:hypothetical protein